VPNLEAQMSTKFEAQMSIPFTGKKAQMSIARLKPHRKKTHSLKPGMDICAFLPVNGIDICASNLVDICASKFGTPV
jgi:hypothetical protein